jgi:hypothetical protein
MTAVGTTPTAAAIRDLTRPFDPMASVYLGPAPTGTLDAAEDLNLRWRSIELQLAQQGADPATLAAIEPIVVASPPYATELAAFAVDGQVRLIHHLPGGVASDRARFAAPADVVPLVTWLQRRPAYVMVVTDRTGADLLTVPAAASSGATQTVAGPDDEIERNAPGGWSQPRYQRRAEDSWQHNAAAVADAVVREVHRVQAGLLLVAGDVRAVQLLRQHLPASVRQHVVWRHLPGGRSPDGSAAVRQAAIDAAVEEHVGGRIAAELAHLADARPGTRVDGPAATLAALAAGRVGTLFVEERPEDARVAWFGSATLCAEAPYGDQALMAGRLVDVAVRAALLTDAEVRVVGSASPTLAGGIGGLCRFGPTE